MRIARSFLAVLLFSTALSLFAAEPSVDLNRADAETIASVLSGVGLRKAEAIVAWREAHGPFRSADDLVQVKGIGRATVETNRDRILIDTGD